MMRKIWICLKECSICGLIGLAFRPGRGRIIPHRGTHAYVDRTAVVTGSGRLFVGIRWKHNRFLPSETVLHPRSRLELRGAFRVYTGHRISVNEGATLVLGDNAYCDNGVNIACFERIEIGSGVKISENVTIRDSDNHTLDDEAPSAPIVIGDNVWIGINATILKGVTVGAGAVVAAGAVVTEDVPPETCVAGVPAAVIRENVQWRL